MGGVLRVTAPDGRVWWVKRAWMPRYRTIRDRMARWLAEREPSWWDEPLRWFAGRGRYVDELPSTEWTALDVANSLDLGTRAAADVVSSLGRALDVPVTTPAPDLLPDVGGGGDLTGLLPGGGSSLPDDLPDAGDLVGLVDVGGASSLPETATGSASGLVDVGGGGSLPGEAAFDVGGNILSGGGGGDAGGGGFDLDVGDDPVAAIALVVGGIVVAIIALLVLWFVVVPLLLTVVDGAILLLVLLSAGLVRLLFRRPWDVVAVEDLADGARRVRRWEVRGYRRAGHVRDDVARALGTGTNPDLAVARAVVREPRDDDPAGTARSVQEIEAYDRHPAAAITPREPRRRGRGRRPPSGSRSRS